METSLPVTSRARPPLPTTLTAWPPRHYSSDKGCAPPVARAHVTVEDAVSGQVAMAIPGLAKPTFERLRRTHHAAQYFDPSNGDQPRRRCLGPDDFADGRRGGRAAAGTDPPELLE